ncbi:MAG: 50S ribosomal protein L9 [Candidatus Omnitrophota bacterium]
MEVILTESMPNLGDAGEIVKVKGGYARNFLIPNGLAYATSSANATKIAHQKRLLTDRKNRRLKTEHDLARRLSEISVQIPVRVGEEDRIFGTVTNQNIAEALKSKGYDVDRRKIILDDPIRALGVYTVPVRFSGDTTAQLKVWVIKEEK